MASLGYNVAAAPHACVRLRRVHRVARRHPLRLVERPDRAGERRPSRDDQPPRMAVIGGLAADRGRLARRLRLHRDPELRPRLPRAGARASAGRSSAGASTRSSGSSSSSSCSSPPDGLMGIWDRLFESRRGAFRRTRRLPMSPVRRSKRVRGGTGRTDLRSGHETARIAVGEGRSMQTGGGHQRMSRVSCEAGRLLLPLVVLAVRADGRRLGVVRGVARQAWSGSRS